MKKCTHFKAQEMWRDWGFFPFFLDRYIHPIWQFPVPAASPGQQCRMHRIQPWMADQIFTFVLM